MNGKAQGHTPGPWETGIVRSSDDKKDVYLWIGPGPDHSNSVATIGLIGTKASKRSLIEANTRLIAAAPALLAEAKRIISNAPPGRYPYLQAIIDEVTVSS